MSLRRTALIPCLLLAALAVVGCTRDIEAENRAEREGNATKVTADSTDDATEAIVNEDFRFRLVPPGPGWKLLREHDARGLNPDAIAGAIDATSRSYGILIVERFPGTTLDEAVALLWKEPLPGLVVESEQDIEFQGVPAKRRVFSAEAQGQPLHFMTTVFLHQDHLYQLMSWSLHAQDSEARLAFQAAFELLDGEVHGSAKREPVTHADGVGWRIRDGQYQSALGGLRLRPPAGWRFLIGTELEQLGSDAEIVATHDASNVFVALTVERAPKARLAGLTELAWRSFMDGQAPIGEPRVSTVAGQQVEFHRFEMPPLGVLRGIHVGDEAITSVGAWYPQALHEDAVRLLDPLLGAIERIPADELATLREQLLGVPNHQRRFSSDRAFRAGEFLDFEHQLRWTMPPGFWSVDNFDKALDHSAETVLFAAELELGVMVAIEAWDTESDEPGALLDTLIGSDEVVSRDTTVVDGLTIHRARSIDRTENPPITHAYGIARRDQKMISVMTWSVDDGPKIQQAMEAALTGLNYDAKLERTRIVDRKYTDLLHGYSFELPRGFEAAPQQRSLGVGQVTAWMQGKQEIVTLTLAGSTDDEAWMSSFFEQILRDTVGIVNPLGKPERSEGTLGGLPARQLTWKAGGTQLHAQIITRDPLVYCMLYSNLSDAVREQVQASFSVLE